MLNFIAAALIAAAPTVPAAPADAHAQDGQHRQHQQGHKGHDQHKGCCEHGQAGHKMGCCKDIADAAKAKACCKDHGKDQAGHQHK